MNAEIKFPYRYFILIFMWLWSLWIIYILLSKLNLPVSSKFMESIKMLFLSIGALGPLMGAISSLRQSGEHGAVKSFLNSQEHLRY
ncbi:MAG: hypothetical protein JW801_03665 [Bacteroidales bacterium]|nr:hypothetical protein [Bacteroidales bacterium]